MLISFKEGNGNGKQHTDKPTITVHAPALCIDEAGEFFNQSTSLATSLKIFQIWSTKFYPFVPTWLCSIFQIRTTNNYLIQ